MKLEELDWEKTVEPEEWAETVSLGIIKGAFKGVQREEKTVEETETKGATREIEF